MTKRAQLLFEQMLNSGLNFLIPIYLTASEGVDVAASYFLLLAYVNLFLTVFRGVLSVPIPYFEKKLEIPNYKTQISVFSFMATCMYGLATIGWTILSSQYDFSAAIAIGAASSFIFAKEALRSMFLAFGEWYAALMSTVFISGLCLIAALMKNLGVIDYIFDFFIIAMFAPLLFFMSLIKPFSGVSKMMLMTADMRLLEILRCHVGYGRFSLLNNLFQSLAMIGFYQVLKGNGTDEVVLFGALFSLVNVASPLFQALNTFLARKMVEVSDSFARTSVILLKSALLIVAFGFAYCSFFYFFGDVVFGMFYPDLTPTFGLIFVIFSLGFAMQGLGYPASRFLAANGKPSIVLESCCFFCVAIVCVYFWLGSFTTASSCGWALLAGRAVSTLYAWGRAMWFFTQSRERSPIASFQQSE
jgi:hypothetical protein